MRRRGFRAAYESWNTICMRGRRRRSARSGVRVMSVPSKLMLPAVGSVSRSRQRPRVDLPQPDSPTSPSVSPARTASDTSSTARSTCRRPSGRPTW